MTSRREQQAKILEGLAQFRPKIETPDISVQEILTALGQFMECVRYLKTRRSKGAILRLENEGDVQDALYLMLRPWITDLVYENPTDKVGNRYTIKDFIARGARTVVEAKYIRNEAHGKGIGAELHDDIETYRHHPLCDNIVFFIYDPESLIPDVLALQAEIAVERTYAGKPLRCHLIVCP